MVTASTSDEAEYFITPTGKDIRSLGDTSEGVSTVGSRLAGVNAYTSGAAFIFVAVHSAGKHNVDVGTTTLVLYNLPEPNGTKTPSLDGRKSFDDSENRTEETASDYAALHVLVIDENTGRAIHDIEVVDPHTDYSALVADRDPEGTETVSDRLNGLLLRIVEKSPIKSGVKAYTSPDEFDGANTNCDRGLIYTSKP